MPSHIDRHIGARISELRSRKKKSIFETGDDAGLEASVLEAYEKGTLRLPASVMLELCRALCIRPDELFAGLDLPAPQAGRGVAEFDDLLKTRARARS